MLQSYVDDSGRFGQDGVFVFAGLVSTVENWARFSDEWADALRLSPSIDYFKASEAAAVEGQFGPLGKERRDERVAILNRIINTHVLFSVACLVDIRAWNRIAHQKISPALDTPFFHAAHHVMHNTIKYINQKRIYDTVDFIFDEQKEKEFFEVQQLWLLMKRSLRAKERWRMGNMPIARNDKLFKPLQGADLCAWSLRRGHSDFRNKIAQADSKVNYVIPERMSVPLHLTIFDEPEIQRTIATTRARIGNIPYETKSERDARHRKFKLFLEREHD